MQGVREHKLVYDWSYLCLGGGISFVLSIWIFKFVGPALSAKFTTSYSRLPGKTRTEWDDRILSNVNAIVAITLGIYILWTGDDMRADAVWHNSKLARLACSIIIGYMTAGIVTMVLWCNYEVKEMIGYTFHHLASIYAYYYVSVHGILCYFAMLRLVAEGSTPFMNQRWFFDITGYRRGTLLVVSNGCLMLLSFFVFRMVMLPIFWYQIWQTTGTESVAMLGHIQITVMYIPSIVLDCLNVYWFHKMCKGFIKAVKTLLNTTTPNAEKSREHLKEG